MSITVQLEEGTVPAGTEIPGTLQSLLAMIAENMGVTGLELFNGVNFGAAQPGPDDQDKPWFKLTGGGAPVGWFAWNGAIWTPIPFAMPFGATVNRTTNPATGNMYFDTDLNVALVFERGSWRTISGSPGDIKHVLKDTIQHALDANPGWVEYEDARGRVIGGAGAGTGLTARNNGDTVGEETHRLSTVEMPAHTHAVHVGLGRIQADGNAAAGAGIIPDRNADATDSTGGDTAHNNMQPTIFLWTLVKQ